MNEFPLFPLSTVLYPDGVLPLKVFERRYLDMIADVMRGDARFGVVSIREGEEVGKAALPADIGTIARIIDFDREQDGLLGIKVRGEQRFVITDSTVQRDNLLVANVRVLNESDPEPLPPEQQRLGELLSNLWRKLRRPERELRLNDAAWVAYRLAEILPLPLDLKQKILEASPPADKLGVLSRQVAGWAMKD
ncbi:MAG: LON peptidase substrate-binding domain-containing protein [Gammaproteobacteria bacterium]|nr:LON peptidase substrate-binding domain-containing protein [Gammaproteobacteria bacterium]MCP5137753.1 LON peptidase substrate-binding domain-containing protein [Gammaproteobacteria bacterium]